MHIRIKDTNICKKCKRKSCARNNVVSLSDFYNITSDRKTCPISIITNGPSDEQLSKGFADFSDSDRKIKCINCGLCIRNCSQSNLENQIETTINVSDIKACYKIQANNLANTIATSYLNGLFEFSANTNLNNNLRFDGYVRLSEEEGCFVETDINDDSLECCRRLLGDLISYNSKNPTTKIERGLIVLGNLPQKGSRDIYTLIEKLRKFPPTSSFKFYFTTLSILQMFFLRFQKNEHAFLELFFLMTEESKAAYIKRLLDNKIITEHDVSVFDG